MMDKKYIWYVRLVHKANPSYDRATTIDDITILNFLEASVKEPSCTILKIEGNHYLVSEDFEQLHDFMDVYYDAIEKSRLLSTLIHLKFLSQLKFPYFAIDIEDIYQFNEEGILIGERARFYEKTLTPQQLEAINSQHPSLSELWALSQNQSYPDIQEVLQYYQHYGDWSTLYKIYEVIKADIKQLEKLKKLPPGTLSQWTQRRSLDFEQSAHSAYISGKDARHSLAASRKVPNVTPMSLDEARILIDRLFLMWVQAKTP